MSGVTVSLLRVVNCCQAQSGCKRPISTRDAGRIAGTSKATGKVPSREHVSDFTARKAAVEEGSRVIKYMHLTRPFSPHRPNRGRSPSSVRSSVWIPHGASARRCIRELYLDLAFFELIQGPSVSAGQRGAVDQMVWCQLRTARPCIQKKQGTEGDLDGGGDLTVGGSCTHKGKQGTEQPCHFVSPHVSGRCPVCHTSKPDG